MVGDTLDSTPRTKNKQTKSNQKDQNKQRAYFDFQATSLKSGKGGDLHQ